MENNDRITYQALYQQGVQFLRTQGIEEAALDARLLLEFVCGTDRNTLLVHGDREISIEEEKRYSLMLEKRGQHIPLQHLTGVQDFMGLTFIVDENVLIPRQDTEILVEEVMKNLHDGMRILDMCTGSGCILLSLLQYSNDCVGVGVDLSAEALAVADANYTRLREDKPEMDAVFLRGNLFEALAAGDETGAADGSGSAVSGRFDIIVSNPPYIRTDVIDTLMPEVREYEPFMALDGRADGLYFYREITKQAKGYLSRGGMLYYEIGCDQAAEVKEILQKEGYRDIEVVKDYAGLDRVVCGVYY